MNKSIKGLAALALSTSLVGCGTTLYTSEQEALEQRIGSINEPNETAGDTFTPYKTPYKIGDPMPIILNYGNLKIKFETFENEKQIFVNESVRSMNKDETLYNSIYIVCKNSKEDNQKRVLFTDLRNGILLVDNKSPINYKPDGKIDYIIKMEDEKDIIRELKKIDPISCKDTI